jgi:hypothetical protein
MRPNHAKQSMFMFQDASIAWTQKEIQLSMTARPQAMPVRSRTNLCWVGCPEGRLRIRCTLNITLGCASKCCGDGGADRVRTDDLRLAKPALSQLSYSPRKSSGSSRIPVPHVCPTRTHACRSDESPDTSKSLQLLVVKWWAWMDLNHRPPAYQADALTS